MMIMTGSVISATNVSTATDSLHHHVFDQKSQRWQQRPPKSKPFVRVRVEVARGSYRELGSSIVNAQTQETTDMVLPDTGASVTMSGTKFMRKLFRFIGVALTFSSWFTKVPENLKAKFTLLLHALVLEKLVKSASP